MTPINGVSTSTDSPATAAASTLSSMMLGSDVALDLSNISVDDSAVKSMVQKTTEAEEDREGGFVFLVSGTGTYNVTGTTRAAGAMTIVDASGNVLWAFKAQAVALALAVIVNSAPSLAHLREFVDSLQAVSMRRHVNGNNVPKTVKGKKGGEFNIDILSFQVDLTGSVVNTDLVLARICNGLHQIITSKHFKNAYIKCMKEMPKLEKLASTIEQDNNPVWATISRCNISMDMPAPLSQYLMDDAILYLMKYVTKKETPTEWSTDDRRLAFLNGSVPGTLLNGNR